MANEALYSAPGHTPNNNNNNNNGDAFAIRSWTTLRKLINEGAFNCQSCGGFFTTAVFCVFGQGTVCHACLVTNRWQGERLKFFELALEDLPVVPCTNAQCPHRMLPEDVAAHLHECRRRRIRCISPGCDWQTAQDDLVRHFRERHRSDVINEATIVPLDIGLGSFVHVKLLYAECFVVVRREPNADCLLYNAFQVDDAFGRGRVCNVAVRHVCDGTQDYTKHFEAQRLDALDKPWTVNRVGLAVLRELSGGTNKLLVNIVETKNHSGQTNNLGELFRARRFRT